MMLAIKHVMRRGAVGDARGGAGDCENDAHD